MQGCVCVLVVVRRRGGSARMPVKPIAVCSTHSCLHLDPFVCSLMGMALLAQFMDGETEVPMGELKPHKPHEEEMVYCGSDEPSASTWPSSGLVCHKEGSLRLLSPAQHRFLCPPDTPGWLNPSPFKALLGIPCPPVCVLSFRHMSIFCEPRCLPTCIFIPVLTGHPCCVFLFPPHPSGMAQDLPQIPPP